MTKFAFPNQKAIQVMYKLESNPDLTKGRRTFDVCYDLEKVFDKSCYQNGQKFRKRVTANLGYAEDHGLHQRLLDKDDEAALRGLYNEWNEAKLEADRLNPNHFAEHSSRYLDCLELALSGEAPDTRILGFFNPEGDLIAYQIYSFSDDWVFVAATACSKRYYSQMSNVAMISFLSFCKHRGYKYVNWGETGGDPKLTAYKEAYPSFRIYYGELKVDFEKSTEQDTDTIVEFMKANSTEAVPFPTVYMPVSIAKGNVLKATVDGKLIGMVELRSVSNENIMTNLIVDPEYRCQGIATMLLNRLQKPFVWFCHKTNDRANNFYSKLPGVVRTGEHKDASGVDFFDYKLESN